MVTLTQLEYLVAVAEERGFNRAADRLNITQPPLSRQIQSLEREIGVQLFDRSRRAIRLTSAGAAYLHEARGILRHAAGAAERARRTELGDLGCVDIGVTSGVAQWFLPAALRRLADELPGVTPVIHELISERQIEALEAGRLDAGIVRRVPPREEFAFRRLPTEDLVLAAPQAWRLGDERDEADPIGHPAVRLSVLEGRDLVAYAPDGAGYFHDLVSAAFVACRVAVRDAQRVVQLNTMLSLVDAAFGAAIVPASAAAWAGPRTDVFRCVDLESFVVEAFLVWRADVADPALFRALDLVAEPHS